MLNKPWFFARDDADSLNIQSLRSELRLNPLRIYRPGAEPGTEPVYNVSTIMSALDRPDASDDKITLWDEDLVEFLAWDILQGGFDFFAGLKNLVVSENTPSIFIPLLNSPTVSEAYQQEDSEVRDYAVRSSEGNSANVLNIILAEFFGLLTFPKPSMNSLKMEFGRMPSKAQFSLRELVNVET